MVPFTVRKIDAVLAPELSTMHSSRPSMVLSVVGLRPTSIELIAKVCESITATESRSGFAT